MIGMIFKEFNEFCRTPQHAALEFYPAELRAEIDALNYWWGNDRPQQYLAAAAFFCLCRCRSECAVDRLTL